MKKPVMIMLVGLSGFVLSVVGFFFLLPDVIKGEIAKQKNLKKGSFSRQMWEHFPDPFTFNVYLFNVTNPDDVAKGGTPKLKQIGPYVYDEYRWKASCKDREADDTVAYRPENWWYFNKTKSGKLTGDEMVTVPNVVLLGVVTLVERDLPGILSMVNQAVTELFRQPKTVYMTVPVKALLFEGVPVNCNVKELSSKSICTTLGVRKSAELKKTGKDMFSFSFLGGRNGTWGEWHRVNRGIRDVLQVGKMVQYKERHQMTVWTGANCNELWGTDGTIFEPYLTEQSVIESFSSDLCRSLTLQFEKTNVHRKVPVYRFSGDFGDISSNPSEMCYCRTENTCPLKGSMDLTRCSGQPVVVSLPHFYKAAAQYQAGVQGLSPEQNKHEIFAELEPNTGTPVNAVSRVQFNIEMHKVGKIDVMKKLKTTMHPIIWIEEIVRVPDRFVNILKNELLFALWLVGIVQWVFIIASILLFVLGIVLHYIPVRSGEVTPILSAATPDRKMSEIRDLLMSSNSSPEFRFQN